MLLPPVPPLPPGCPWSGWTPPNIKWCEDNLCGWITTPANTWSNLAYLAVALFVWRRARTDSEGLLRLYAPACAFLGGASFLFHASYTLFFQFFDYLGMFVILALLIATNLRRAGWVSGARAPALYAALVVALSASIPCLHAAGLPYQLLIVFLSLLVIAQELHLYLRGPRASSYAWFFRAVGALFLAAAFAALDLTRCWCDPANHWLQGHVLWHVASALALYSAYRFFELLELPG
ncbi:MAG: ceramidase domain-containing protein [Candidatus Wallbacteria bacterium]|nr:ceramidase domain-containing protein [Candidatus Wallbacteria bacterium]